MRVTSNKDWPAAVTNAKSNVNALQSSSFRIRHEGPYRYESLLTEIRKSLALEIERAGQCYGGLKLPSKNSSLRELILVSEFPAA